jgi:hypothetical protein
LSKSILLTYLFSSCFIFFVISNGSFFAQQTENSLPVDSLLLQRHSPKKATYYSMVVPGLGQFYNKKYWKIPIIYAGFATLAYLVKFNGSRYTKYINAYGDLIDDDTLTTRYRIVINEAGLDEEIIVKELYPETYDPSQYEWFVSSLELNKDYYKRNRDLSYIGLGIWYILNIVDAAVDAHLFNYDISDDLSLRIEPKLIPVSMYANTIGIKLSFRF